MPQVNLFEQNEWVAKPNEDLKIPAVYITELRYEIVVFGRKKEFTFRCRDYDYTKGTAWRFDGVIIDTSEKNAKRQVTLKRVSYHPEIVLVNVPFMVMPAPESATPPA
jgi:hypothetical protein